jgi:hypothetical protein
MSQGDNGAKHAAQESGRQTEARCFRGIEHGVVMDGRWGQVTGIL